MSDSTFQLIAIAIYLLGMLAIGYAAFRKGEATQVIAFRQKMKNLDLPKEKAEIFVETPKAPVSVTVRRVDEEHGNPLKLWEEMGSPVSLTPKEIHELTKQSAVCEENWDYSYAGGAVRLEIELGVNDVYMIEIK